MELPANAYDIQVHRYTCGDFSLPPTEAACVLCTHLLLPQVSSAFLSLCAASAWENVNATAAYLISNVTVTLAVEGQCLRVMCSIQTHGALCLPRGWGWGWEGLKMGKECKENANWAGP